MKRLFFISATLAVFVFGLSLAAQAKTISLTYSSFFPPTHEQSKLAEAWCKEVETKTNGQVKITFYPGGTLTQAKDCYDGVVQGVSDIGMSALAYSRGRFPVMAAVDLPLGYKNGKAATTVANNLYDKFKPKELSDVQVLYFHAHGPGLLHTAKKPVQKLEDLKGLKIRATGNSGQLVSALGGISVAMSMPESYEAIQKGVADGSMYPAETNKGWNMADVVKYMTESTSVAYTTVFFVVMNKDKWGSLPADVQKTLLEINKTWAAKHGQVWDDSDTVGRNHFLSKGGKVLSLTPAESKRWADAAQPMLDEYVKEVDKKGLKGKDVLDFTAKALQSVQK